MGSAEIPLRFSVGNSFPCRAFMGAEAPMILPTPKANLADESTTQSNGRWHEGAPVSGARAIARQGIGQTG
jgi:hypothetical protein